MFVNISQRPICIFVKTDTVHPHTFLKATVFSCKKNSACVLLSKLLFSVWGVVFLTEGEVMIRCRSISTVEGSGATCTRNFFEFFFQNRWSFYGPVDLKNSKKWKKCQKCIDITLHKWSWRPLWQVGKKSISRFHSQPGALFGWFCNFPHQVRCGGGVENCQTTQKVHLVGCGSG